MESFLNRYRNITVLLLVIVAQLVLLAVQVKNDQDVRIIRIWTVTAVTPVARVIEGFRGGGLGFVRNYILLHDVNAENRRLQAELGRLKMENIFLKNELHTADRAKALQVFQEHTLSKTVAATVILASAGSSSNVRFLDRGSFSGVQRGMAVVTPDGIVGKIIASYPSASEMLMVTDPEFAAGVMSQNGQVRGTLKGQGNPTLCKVDYVPFQEKVEVGEQFFTSGDDRIFPRGFPVGVVKEVRNAQPFKEIYLTPAGILRGVEDVLIVLEGVHQEIPRNPPANQPVYVAPAPPGPGGQPNEPQQGGPAPAGTEADKLRLQYKAIGETQNHTYGAGGPGSKPPDFTKLPDAAGGVVAAPAPAARPNNPAAPGQARPTAAGEPAQQPGRGQPSNGKPAVVPGQEQTVTPGQPPKPANGGTQPPANGKPAASPGKQQAPGAVPLPKTPGGEPPTSGTGRAGTSPNTQAPANSGQPQPPAPVRRANQAGGPGGFPPE